MPSLGFPGAPSLPFPSVSLALLGPHELFFRAHAPRLRAQPPGIGGLMSHPQNFTRSFCSARLRELRRLTAPWRRPNPMADAIHSWLWRQDALEAAKCHDAIATLWRR